MARVLCIENCWIDRYYEAGEEYPDYRGPASPHLKVLDDPEPKEETAPQKAGRATRQGA